MPVLLVALPLAHKLTKPDTPASQSLESSLSHLVKLQADIRKYKQLASDFAEKEKEKETEAPS